MRLSNEMAQAYTQVADDILSRMQYISEVIILATLVNPNDFDPSAYADKVTNAMTRHKSGSDLRVRGVKIIGKRSAFSHTAVTGSAVVQRYSACVGIFLGKTCSQ